MALPRKQPDRTRLKPFAGLDEAGRGCLAGPVVAAAVILPDTWNLPDLDDSKKVSPKKRLELEKKIKASALGWGLGVVWPADIDRLNILRASLLAMAHAALTMKMEPRLLLIDGNQRIPDACLNQRWRARRGSEPPIQETIIGGDGLEPSIAAASILAKTFRDRLMIALDRVWPGYDFASSKGYGVRKHREALLELGPSPMHRLTFAGVTRSQLYLFPKRI
ncbi:MAG: ribonuclease HII [Desulfovibrio sp.]|nr:ribonuclease HII [Desulfovibrio sp.]